jgi:GTP-binding protein Era
LEQKLIAVLPEREPMFPEDQITDRSERFLVAEIVREKLTRTLGQEVPYALAVTIERFDSNQSIVQIGAIVWVERKSQKAIVIGKGGSNLKKVGKSAREDIERLLGRRVNLTLWVKVKEGWSRDERIIQSLGYQIPEP